MKTLSTHIIEGLRINKSNKNSVTTGVIKYDTLINELADMYNMSDWMRHDLKLGLDHKKFINVNKDTISFEYIKDDKKFNKKHLSNIDDFMHAIMYDVSKLIEIKKKKPKDYVFVWANGIDNMIIINRYDGNEDDLYLVCKIKENDDIKFDIYKIIY